MRAGGLDAQLAKLGRDSVTSDRTVAAFKDPECVSIVIHSYQRRVARPTVIRATTTSRSA